ncbi:cupin domain-containing protein [Almyronema epifaneia]|uniref:Cupin domain-containing protein n=1 Tax=Almyronema epifaneia S1 TaxID=2991925 RepID=A0ABW6IBC3_9CYAN
MKHVSLKTLPEEAVSHNPAIKKRVLLRSGDLPHLTNFAQARFSPGQLAAAHAHKDMCEVFFVEAGDGIIRINNTDYELQVGTCIAVEPGEVHEVINTGAVDLVLTYFGLAV